MAAEVVPYFLPQFFDNNGKPLAGGKIYTYKAGTTTPIATYKDASFTPNENPIILDSAGRASIYVGIQPVKFVICDADDNVIETRDHVSGASSTAVGIQTIVPIETDGVETEFDLGIDPQLPQNCTVVLVTSGGDRITFLTSEYTVSGTKIIFNSPPPAGTGEVRIGATRAIASSGLSDGSVSTPKLQDGAVTNTKLADNSVGTSKLQDEAVTNEKLADEAVTSQKIAIGAVGLNHLRSDVGIPRGAISSTEALFSTTSMNFEDVLGTDGQRMSVTFTSTGKPIRVSLLPIPKALTGIVQVWSTSQSQIGAAIYVSRQKSGDAPVRVASVPIGIEGRNTLPANTGVTTPTIGSEHRHILGGTTSGTNAIVLPPGIVSVIDLSPPVGVLTYWLVTQVITPDTSIAIGAAKLLVEELGWLTP